MTNPPLPADLLREAPICLVDFAEAGPPRLFQHPTAMGYAWQESQVIPTLAAAERFARQGHWVVVVAGYEAAGAFDLPVCQNQEIPLVWYGVFTTPHPVLYPPPAPNLPPCSVSPLITEAAYEAALGRIAHHLLAGESYQVNFTLPHQLPPLDDARLFLELQCRGRYPYAAWLAVPMPHQQTWRIASLSPELFLKRQGSLITSGPIKGTCGRGDGLAAEVALRQQLRTSPKEQAEHVMIVDMVRNDLGRICRVGGVRVPRLMETRVFTSLLHLETRVEGELRENLGLVDIFAALFPAASVTGAPKHHTMAIIRTLEGQPRGLYTGAIGLLEPGGDFIFNVAIRTLTWLGDQPGILGLGGGIVADSQWPREWQELAEKAAFLTRSSEPLSLLETMAWDGEFVLLAAHLDRLAASAAALAMPFDRRQAEELLAQWSLAHPQPCTVRLTLKPDGTLTLNQRPLPMDPPTLRIQLAAVTLDRLDPLARHKSDRRRLLDLSLQAAPGYDDVLFLNGDGWVAEGSMRAVVALIDGHWLAPPLSTGILPSLWRRQEIARLGAKEEVITLERLLQAQEIRMGNSVRGGRRVACLDNTRGETIWNDCRDQGDSAPYAPTYSN